MRVAAAYVPPSIPSERFASKELLETIAQGLSAFGPTIDLSSQERVFLVDVTGCAGLFGANVPRGEAVLARKLGEFFASIGLGVHVAIAEGPLLAGIFAKLGRSSDTLVSKERTRTALAHVPLSLLPLSERELRYFLRLGLGTVADLQRLPKESLAHRLEGRREKQGHKAAARTDLMSLLQGEDRTALCAYRKHKPPCAEFDLSHPTVNTEALAFVFKSLCDDMWAQMRGLSVRKLTATLRVGRGARARSVSFECTFVPALGNREDVLAAVRAKLERVFVEEQLARRQNEFDEVEQVALRFDETVPTVLANLSLYGTEARHVRALPKLLTELRESLGEERVGRLCVQDSWQMHERSVLMPETNVAAGAAAALLNVLEPTRVVSPSSIGHAVVEPLRLLLRLERSAWFVVGNTPLDPRDVLVAWYDEHVVCLERTGARDVLCGFFD